MTKKLALLTILMVLLATAAALGQVPADQQRILQPIIVNGQQTQGALVVQNGGVQTFTCPSPQQYVTANQSESGWACFEQSTGMWLLHAQPPVQAATPPPAPTVVYSQPTTVYVPTAVVPAFVPYYDYYSVPYPYYYPYGYYARPRVSIGFGFGFGPRYGYGFGYGYGYRAPIIVSRPVIHRPVVIGRSFHSVPSRSFVGVRSGRSSGGFSRIARR